MLKLDNKLGNFMIFSKKRHLIGLMFGLLVALLVYIGGRNPWYAMAAFLVACLQIEHCMTTMAIEDPEWKEKVGKG